MLVESVKVENFKLFGDFAVEGLRPVTLLGGDNGCGKTTLLEAVFLCFNRKWDQSRQPPILNPLREDVSVMTEDTLAHLFHEGNLNAPITASCIASGIAHAVTVAPVSEQESEKIAVPFADTQKVSGKSPLGTRAARRILVEHTEASEVKSRAVVTLDSNGLQAKAERVDTVTKFVQIVRDSLLISGFAEDADNLSKLEVKGKKEAVLEALQIVAPQATNVAVASVRSTPSVYVRMGKAHRMIPSTLLGAGAQKALSWALSLHSHDDGLFLLDEVTVGWHHSRLVDLWRMIFRICKERNHQVIATTHSYEGITAFAEAATAENAEGDACYVRLRNSDECPGGKNRPTVFGHDDIAGMNRAGLELR